MIFNFGKKIFGLFAPFYGLYRKIRDDENRKKKSVLFGLLAILFCLVSLAIVYPGVKWGLKGMVYACSHYFGIGTWFFGIANIFILAFSFLGFALPYYLWIQSLLLLIWQFFLNRKFISWFALIVWLATLVGILYLTALSLDLIVNPWLQQAHEDMNPLISFIK